jgi:hypothetical protein
MGVSIFRDYAPASFSTFDRALSTMFRLTAGETWVDGLAAYSAEDGRLYYGTALFIYSYIAIVVWILLQVSVAVLLVRTPPGLSPRVQTMVSGKAQSPQPSTPTAPAPLLATGPAS